MKPDDPIGRDVRKLRRARRLGDGAACVLCGTRNPVALVRAERSLLEAHHLGGKANDDSLVVVVCKNCHAELTEAQHESGIELRRDRERVSLARLEAVLRGLADFFALLVVGLRGWADELARGLSRLDREHPGWRDKL